MLIVSAGLLCNVVIILSMQWIRKFTLKEVKSLAEIQLISSKAAFGILIFLTTKSALFHL